MPKAEVGSTKHLANKMKAKGLQRLRWYCQICEKQCRDENGFKQHTMSESHVRNMLQVGEDPRKYINDYSNQFKRDFLQLLKTSHGEKKISMNVFYQEYIRDKEHIHMNATKWPSLTEFAKFLGREGICRVEEGDRGLEIAFIDDSAEAIRRRDDVQRKEQQAKGDEDLESRLLNQQIKKAKAAAKKAGNAQEEQRPNIPEEAMAEPFKMSFKLGAAAKPITQSQKEPSSADAPADIPVQIDSFSATDGKPTEDKTPAEDEKKGEEEMTLAPAPPKISMSLSAKPKPSNPLMGGKKSNPLAGKKEAKVVEPEKKMSNAERIMKEEMERKRLGDQRGYRPPGKRQRLG